MNWNLRPAGLAVLSLLVLTGHTHAAVIVFSDRPSWEAAVSGSMFTEDFEQEPISLAFPYTTAGGLILDDVFDTGNVVGDIGIEGQLDGPAMHIRAFSGDQLAISFPVPVLAFGFDYFAADDVGTQRAPWVVQVNTLATSLPGFSLGFFGVVLTQPTLPLTSFTLSNAGFAQGGIDVDNVSYVPSSSTPIPEPSTMLLLGAGLSTSLLFRLRRRTKRRDIH